MSKQLGIKYLISCWLADNEFNGLYNSDQECGCTLNDLMPCDAPHLNDCQPGYLHKVDPAKTSSGFDYTVCGVSLEDECPDCPNCPGIEI